LSAEGDDVMKNWERPRLQDDYRNGQTECAKRFLLEEEGEMTISSRINTHGKKKPQQGLPTTFSGDEKSRDC